MYCEKFRSNLKPKWCNFDDFGAQLAIDPMISPKLRKPISQFHNFHYPARRSNGRNNRLGMSDFKISECHCSMGHILLNAKMFWSLLIVLVPIGSWYSEFALIFFCWYVPFYNKNYLFYTITGICYHDIHFLICNPFVL